MARTFLNELLQSLVDRGRAALPGRVDDVDLGVLAEQVLSELGEASGTSSADALLRRYAQGSDAERTAFLVLLARDFGADPTVLDPAIDAYRAAPNGRTGQALHAAAEPRRQELIRRLNLAPGGTAALVRMRADLIDRQRANPDLATAEADFLHLLAGWCNRAFLVLRPIQWDTPANILEKIMHYEGVHNIVSWDDLRARLLPPDRRCFAYFHPQLGDEPLIFVEVALTRDMPASIGEILGAGHEPIAAEATTTAVFYSISSTQKGLAGISFGHSLIKQVVEELHRDLPNLKSFVTLSPAPGFAQWLSALRSSGPLTATEVETLNKLDAPTRQVDAELERLLTVLAARYYLHAKRADGYPADPVARFHLGNGARLERINPAADLSARAHAQSHGMMVNYRYDLADIEANHERYARKEGIAASAAVRKLLASSPTLSHRLIFAGAGP